MSVTIRPYRRGGWEVDVRVVAPDGSREIRERKRAHTSARSAAVRWAAVRGHAVAGAEDVDVVLTSTSTSDSSRRRARSMRWHTSSCSWVERQAFGVAR